MRKLLFALLTLIVLAGFLPPTTPTSAQSVPAASPTPRPQADAPLEPGGFVRAEGRHLTRLGVPVQVKGVNYYPRGRPWKAMWHQWDAPQIQRELRLGRDELGINAVRVLLPYDMDRTMALRRLKQFVQIAGALDLRVIITLFDFHDHFPPPGTRDEARHFDYLDDIIGNFAGDDRILAWDLHNEPDHYPTWQNGNADAVLLWLSRMADHVHQIAPNHLVTVGMGQYDSLWQPGPDGRRVLDYSDVVSVHIYNAADTARQLYELRQHTDKPLLLGEFGWPSGPTCIVDAYSETTQAWVYDTMLASAASEVAGVIAWTLRDYDSGPTMRWDTREEHYGLMRRDDTLKPAAAPFRAYAASPLPSSVHTGLPLTVEDLQPPGGKFAPQVITETGYHVKSWIRVAWDEFDGYGSYGLPLNEAFLRPDDALVVQYFEAAVLVFDPSYARDPGFERLSMAERARRIMRFEPIGQAYTAGRDFPQPDHIPREAKHFPQTGYTIQGSFLEFYNGLPGEWRLGLPLSEQLTEDINGVPTRVQYFEYGRLEADPATDAIRFGQLGSWAFAQQCTPPATP